jgi:tetratricopeptide (TPR) repeat protein
MAGAPTAKGTLRERSLAQLFAFVLDRQRSGSLQLLDDVEEIAIVTFTQGYPQKARTRARSSFLGQILHEKGIIDAAAIERSLSAARAKGKLQGALLLETGLVSEAELKAALVEQLARKIAPLFALPESTGFRWYEGADLLAGWGGDDAPPIDPIPLLWHALKEAPPLRHVDALLARIGEGHCTLVPGAALDRLHLTPEERAAAELLWEPQPPSALRAALPGRIGDLLLYALHVSRMLRLAESQAPISLRPAQVTVPPAAASTPSAPIPTRSLVPERPTPVPSSSPRPSSPGFRAPSSPRPSPLPRPMHAPQTSSRPIVPTAIASGGAADHGGSPPSRTSSSGFLIAPKDDFERAQMALSRRDFAEAAACAERHVALHPNHPRAIAMLAWAQSHLPEHEGQAATRALIRRLGEALAIDPECESAYFYRAQLRRKVGEEEAALRDFKAAATINPHNVDAAREVRLYEMRGKKSGGGLFDRFKKK